MNSHSQALGSLTRSYPCTPTRTQRPNCLDKARDAAQNKSTSGGAPSALLKFEHKSLPAALGFPKHPLCQLRTKSAAAESPCHSNVFGKTFWKALEISEHASRMLITLQKLLMGPLTKPNFTLQILLPCTQPHSPQPAHHGAPTKISLDANGSGHTGAKTSEVSISLSHRGALKRLCC